MAKRTLWISVSSMASFVFYFHRTRSWYMKIVRTTICYYSILLIAIKLMPAITSHIVQHIVQHLLLSFAELLNSRAWRPDDGEDEEWRQGTKVFRRLKSAKWIHLLCHQVSFVVHYFSFFERQSRSSENGIRNLLLVDTEQYMQRCFE